MSGDLVAFLRARLDDDEERARFVQREQGDRAQPESEPWRLSWHLARPYLDQETP